MKDFIRYQLPAILWAGAIFTASSVPGGRVPWALLHRFDKLIHIGIFFVFGILVYWALQGGATPVSSPIRRTILMLLIVIGYGLFDEIHQISTPLRTFDTNDLLADATGGALAAGSAYLYRRWRGAQGKGEG